MSNPITLDFSSDLAAGQPLLELKVYMQGSRLLASMIFELDPASGKALSPAIGEQIEDEHGNLLRPLPAYVLIPGLPRPTLEALSVPPVV